MSDWRAHTPTIVAAAASIVIGNAVFETAQSRGMTQLIAFSFAVLTALVIGVICGRMGQFIRKRNGS